MNRRTFVRAGAALAATGVGTFGYATMIEPHWLEYVRRDLPILNLPAQLVGAKLAQVSDLHACTIVDENYLTRSLDGLRKCSPDIVALTGDFLTWEEGRPSNRQLDQLKRVLSHLPHGRLATIGILGNHDWGFRTWDNPVVAANVTRVAESSGIQILRNEVQNVAGLDVIGMDDLWAGGCHPQLAFKQRTSDAALALSHNPDSLDAEDWSGYSGWILAGHTHGGQCKPPFLPPPILPVKNHRYTSGEIAVNAERKLYISRGVGHLLKVRFLVRPEITIFTLRAA